MHIQGKLRKAQKHKNTFKQDRRCQLWNSLTGVIQYVCETRKP